MSRVAKALIFDPDGRALVLWRSETHPLYGLEADLPGGIIESAERFEQGLAREVREEVGLEIDSERFEFVATRHRSFASDHRLYRVRLDVRPSVTLSWEHVSYRWVAPAELAEALASRDPYMHFAQKSLRLLPPDAQKGVH